MPHSFQKRQHIRNTIRRFSFNQLIPNILTTIGLCAGLNSMLFAIHERFQMAAIALLIAAFIDGLDGRVARLLHGSTQFGAEFDSLSDFLCFGIAPPFLLYFWAFKNSNPHTFLSCILFSVCMAFRRARFNVTLNDQPFKPQYTRNFFVGVPAPAGAGLALFPLFLGLEAQKLHINWLYDFTQQPWVPCLTLTGTALLLISTLPVWSLKSFKIPRRYILPIMICIGIYAFIFITDLWAALTAAGLIYIFLLPFSRWHFLKLKNQFEAEQHASPTRSNVLLPFKQRP